MEIKKEDIFRGMKYSHLKKLDDYFWKIVILSLIPILFGILDIIPIVAFAIVWRTWLIRRKGANGSLAIGFIFAMIIMIALTILIVDYEDVQMEKEMNEKSILHQERVQEILETKITEGMSGREKLRIWDEAYSQSSREIYWE